MKACRYAKAYKAVRPPRCNRGDPCDECKRKWAEKCALGAAAKLADAFKRLGARNSARSVRYGSFGK